MAVAGPKTPETKPKRNNFCDCYLLIISIGFHVFKSVTLWQACRYLLHAIKNMTDMEEAVSLYSTMKIFLKFAKKNPREMSTMKPLARIFARLLLASKRS